MILFYYAHAHTQRFWKKLLAWLTFQNPTIFFHWHTPFYKRLTCRNLLDSFPSSVLANSFSFFISFPAQEGDSSELSPYPEVDAFINSLVSSNGRHGKIRHWFYFMEGNLLGYDIVGYRWCGNINRQHKSNNIR